MKIHIQLLRTMVQLSNNSILTHETCNMLIDKLDEKDLKKLEIWLIHTQNLKSNQINNAKKRSRW